MAHPGFGHLWQQAEMSDLDIVMSCDHAAAAGGAVTGTESMHVHATAHLLVHRQRLQQLQQDAPPLQQFPWHSTILSLSPFFKAQALRWSTPSQPQGRTRSGKGKAANKRQAKQQITITLPDASYEPAAMAVRKGLYQVEPWPKLLADLTPQQQVQAAMLADMWQLTAASEAAVALLQEPGSSDRQSAVLEQLVSMAAVPDCLMPLFEQSRQALLNKYLYEAAVPANVQPLFELALLSKYGDLEAVWAPDAVSLQESLLELPLHVMELLLASDRLKVASEDTVLFIAQAYVDNLLTPSTRLTTEALQDTALFFAQAYVQLGATGSQQQAVDRLAPLVRCPHLSQHWLSALVLSDDADKLLLRGLQPQLKRLLLLKPACSTATGLSAADIERGIPGVPASWLLPVRDITPVASVEIEWEVNVTAIRQAAEDSAACQGTTSLTSPTSSSPLGGVRWGITLQCSWDAREQGSKVGLFANGASLPTGSFCRCTYSLNCAAVAFINRPAGYTSYLGNNWGKGFDDFFRLGAMPGGFDEAAWVAKGLPTSGSIKLQLTVKDVGM